MNHCENCKYWNTELDLAEWEEEHPEFGYCEKQEVKGCSDNVGIKVIVDDPYVGCYFLTKYNFGCIYFKSKKGDGDGRLT